MSGTPSRYEYIWLIFFYIGDSTLFFCKDPNKVIGVSYTKSLMSTLSLFLVDPHLSVEKILYVSKSAIFKIKTDFRFPTNIYFFFFFGLSYEVRVSVIFSYNL